MNTVEYGVYDISDIIATPVFIGVFRLFVANPSQNLKKS